MPEFKLNKPLYHWTDDLRTDNYYDLADELVEWLDQHNVSYSCNTRLFNNTLDGNAYLHHYIDIPDPDQAMLFKLTWL